MDTPCLSPQEKAAADAESSPADAAPAPESCPRCQEKLIDPMGLGWCKACGYCKSLEEDKAKFQAPPKPTSKAPSSLGLVEAIQVMAMLPTWVWVMVGGMAAVAAINLPPARAFAPNGLGRALWSSIEIGLGILLILAAQIWALFIVGHHDEKLSFKDAIISGRLWGLTLRNLPETRGMVWLATWGIACILSAVFIMGGLGYWGQYLPRSTPAMPAAPAAEELVK
jgi:hypothetical protein